MIQIQIDAAEILAVMQREFPKEYTICVQQVHISKLEAMVEDSNTAQVDPEPPKAD